MRAAIVAMVSIVTVSEAHAQEAPRERPAPTVMLVYRARDPFGMRLEGELRSIGVRVVARSHLSHAVPAGTIAVATIFGEPRPRIEIRMGRHPREGEPDVLVDVGDTDEGLKTTKAAESVRAAIQLFVEAETARPTETPIEPAPSPPSAEPLPPPAEPLPRSLPPRIEPSRVEPSRPEPSREITPPRPPKPPATAHWLALTAGVSAIVGSQGTGFDVESSAIVSPLPWLHIEPFVSIPFVPATLEAKGGEADLYAALAGARVGFTIVRESLLTLDVGGGFAGLWLRAVGQPAEGYRGFTVDGFTPAALVDVTPRLDVYGGLRVSPRISLGVALPPPEIVFAGDDAGTWGAPFGEVGLSAEIAVIP